MERIEYTLGFMFNQRRDRVVLIRKYKPSWQFLSLNGVGGKLQEGEAPVACMVREFFEETKTRTKLSDWELKGTLEGDAFKVYVYRSFQLPSSFQLKEMDTDMGAIYHRLECSEGSIGLYSVDQYGLQDKSLRGDLISNLRWLIPFLLDANENCKKPYLALCLKMAEYVG